MRFGICGLSSIPIRKDPSEKSEMISQVLFGEHFEIKEEFFGWSFILLHFDGVCGWINNRMINPISVKKKEQLEKKRLAISTGVFNLISNNQQQLMLVAGSTLPLWKPIKKQFSIGGDFIDMNGEYSDRTHKNARDFIIKQALMYFNVPYLWGGRSPFGIDAGGLVQILFKMLHINLPRGIEEQVLRGTALSFVEECENGDLAFFQNGEGEIVHVGIIWEKNKIIHASGRVRIDNIDQYGIYNNKENSYTHNLRVLKRLLPL